MCDNTATVQSAKDPKFYRKTKHIKRHYHFVRDAIKEKEVAIKCILMPADPLAKPIPTDAFKAHAMSLGLRRL